MNKNKVSKNFGGGVTDFFLGGGGLPPKTGLQETLPHLPVSFVNVICRLSILMFIISG